jgi:hypothetical protein
MKTMKILNRISKGFLLTASFALVLSSCSEDIMDDINKDINHSQDAQAKFIVADILTATAFSNTGGDISTYMSSYVEHEVGTHNQLFRGENRQNEPSAASTFNNTWGSLYSALKNAKIVIDKCSVGGTQEGNVFTKGVAEVLAAYNLALLTDMFGDVPWLEACDYTAHMNPVIDKQEDIYGDILAYIESAIVDLQGNDAHATGGLAGYDLMYNGHKANWLKFAYGLKARYTMRLLKRSSNVNTDLEMVITCVDNSFQSASEQAAFAIYDASNLNPLFDFQWSRDGLAASESMAEKLIARNDPRLRRVFVDPEWEQITGPADPAYFMAPNGANEELQYWYNTSIFVYSQIAPTLLLSYHEVLFLKAEALCRLTRPLEAEPVLKQAVIAAIANTERSISAAFDAPTVNNYGGISENTAAIDATEAGTYFDAEVKPLFDANPLSETMIQKYIGFFGASGEAPECYNDIRRMKALGENFVVLNNPNNATKFPLRLPYGNDDTTANPNVQVAYGDGQYVYAEPVWWAGGTR